VQLTKNTHTTKKNIIANNIGNAWNVITLLVAVPIYIQYLGIENYSMVAFFSILGAWSILLDFGLRATLERQISKFYANNYGENEIVSLLHSVELFIIFIGSLVVISTWLASDWLAYIWLDDLTLSTGEIKKSFIFMSFIIAFRAVESIYSRALLALHKQVLQNTISIIIVTIQNFGAIGILAWISPTIEMLFLWYALISIISMTVFCLFAYKSMPFLKGVTTYSWSSLLQSWNFTVGMFLVLLLTLITSQVDKILASNLFTVEIFSFYMLAGMIIKGMGLFSESVSAAIYPHFITLIVKKNASELKIFYHKSVQTVAVFSGSFASVIFIFSEEVIMVWTKDENLSENIAPIMMALVLGELARGLLMVSYRLQMSYAWTTLHIKLAIINILIVIFASLFLMPLYGSIGLAISLSFANFLILFLSAYIMHKKIIIGEFRYWLLYDIFIPISCSFIVIIICAQFIPENTNRLFTFFGLFISFFIGLISAALVTPLTRKLIFKITNKFFLNTFFNKK
jgi:O-antigen/teichoic acid export membrane protein